MLALTRGIEELLSEEKWLICQDRYVPELNLQYETNFTLANGYMGTRGAFEEGSYNEHPGNFIAGVFNKSEAQVREIVNVQNWLGIKLYVNEELISLDECEILDFKRILDMKKGILARKLKIQDAKGRITSLEGFRFLSRHDMHRAGIYFLVTPLNYSGTLSIESIIDGTVTNTKESPKYKVKHLKIVENCDLDKNGCYLETATRDDDLHIGVGSSVRIINSSDFGNVIKYRRFAAFGEQSIEYCEFDVSKNEPVIIEKFVVTYTTRDVEKKELKGIVARKLCEYASDGIWKEFEKHAGEYEKLWNIVDVNIKGDAKADKALRFNIFHLVSSVNENDPMVSIAAKALHGEGYKGHVFWDTEIFMLPFFTYSYPKAAKTLLMYRYNMLDAARENARINGYRGAQFPWESADTGREETPRCGFDYKGNPVRIWTGDIEYHITSDIAFAIFDYYRATDDLEFMLNYGAEVILETARFWCSRCEYNKEMDRYEINCVIGPDEFHEHVNNNCYTNYMAKWNIKKAFELIELFKEKYPNHFEKLSSKICLTNSELKKWAEVMEKIYIPYDRKNKLIEQFEGYFEKKDYIINKFDENDMPVWPEGVDITRLNDTQLVKQADVIMLLLLMGDEFDHETRKVNYEYYEKRTMHKSSLGPSMYSIMGLKVGDFSKAYQCFMRTANVDLTDNQGNTAQGLHAAAAGGTWQVAVFGFGGMHVDKEGILCFNPWLPEKWEALSFKIYWKGNLLNVEIEKENVRISMLEGQSKEIVAKVNGKKVHIKKRKKLD